MSTRPRGNTSKTQQQQKRSLSGRAKGSLATEWLFMHPRPTMRRLGARRGRRGRTHRGPRHGQADARTHAGYDEDRCYYGEVGEDGSVLVGTKPTQERGPLRPPGPDLGPLDVIEQQFRAFEDEDVERAFSFVSPKIVERYSLDVDRFRGILSGASFEGVVGCASRAGRSAGGASTPRREVGSL